MDAYPLPVRPSDAVVRVAPTVDLRDRVVDMADQPSHDVWEWCVEFTRRFVADANPGAKAVNGLTIKGADRTCGADLGQLGRVLAALDKGQPVAFFGWWPTEEVASTTVTLGLDVFDVPTPDRKGTALLHGHAVVVLGYARHDAFAGGGYLVVRNPRAGATWGEDGIGYVPFTYFRAYATTLWTARPELRVTRGADDRPPPRTTADVDRQIAAGARCADPRGNYTALFFSERTTDTLRAKAICSVCPVRELCLARALERREPYGVWGGEFLVEGEIVGFKRGRGRPSLRPIPVHVDEITGEPLTPAVA